MEFRDLKAQYHTLHALIDRAVSRVLESGAYIGGPEVAALECELTNYVGAAHCITCANGTDAISLALMAWGVGSGDAVFVPDFTFFASGEAPALLGATPVFVDVDEHTFNLDPQRLDEAICFVDQNTQLTSKVVVAVDLFGLPANYSALKKVCQKHGLLILEDAAQGFGGGIGSQKACSFGDISITSFFPAKPLGCYGDGGAVFTNNDDWAALLRSLAVHGKGAHKYDNVRIGVNSRLDALQAAILRAKFPAFKAFELDRVNKVAQIYTDALTHSKLILPKVPDGYTSSWAQYSVVLPEQCNRDALQDCLAAQNIPTAVYYPRPMHEQPAFTQNHVYPQSCPISEHLSAQVLSLPMGPYMPPEDVHQVARLLLGTIS